MLADVISLWPRPRFEAKISPNIAPWMEMIAANLNPPIMAGLIAGSVTLRNNWMLDAPIVRETTSRSGSMRETAACVGT